MNLLTVPIVSGTLAGVSFVLLLLVLAQGGNVKADPAETDPSSAGSWEDYLPGGKA